MKVSEVYVSTQGEGPRVGEPTIFVRLAGCNLRCPGWPCDTPYAIFPKEYRKEWVVQTANELLTRIRDQYCYPNIDNICITGGEPFIQQLDELEDLCRELVVDDRKKVEFFSNGTVYYPQWVNNCTVVMDWKLSGSGEKMNQETLNVRRLNYQFLVRSPDNSVKFTVANRDDFDEALAVWKEISISSVPQVRRRTLQFFCGPVWDKVEPSEVADWILETGVPWRLNIQAHKYIFGDKRGI